ncbi:hypothetical protein [Fulvivirga lutea]|uniref:DUF5666 domain-containing protein n=1 Tax=Fulvivirga lutea TaxID=2810512 RepID=A0A974WDP8_9BACT|nr:hypothetical protein [Fulvivirga lutea]QSE95971.1 hypothetical protein JR347_10095 [Fulvivirga lutea]
MKTTNNILALVLVFLASVATAQDQGFIYGKVTTIDGKTFEGPIRWGKEEAYWTDMFNAAKEENNNLKYLSRDEMDQLEERYYRSHTSWGERWGDRWEHKFGNWFNVNWDDNNNKHQHQFVCQFGDLKSVRPTGRERAEVVLQNGQKFEVDGQGYNDVATDVKIRDKEIGEIKLDWSRIDIVEFMSTPSKLNDKFGEPLYGTVETYGGTFTGFVQWDHDERVSTDKLDGDTEDGDVSIEFGNLKSIEREGFRSVVVLKSGREMELRGSNDVNSDNRGIVVTSEKLGRVDIPWREFKKVTFISVNEKPKSYDSFKDQNEITGTVKTTDGQTLKGKLIFDLDEEYNYEVVQGMNDDIEYVIPFRSISKIAPKNYDNSSITLKNGETFNLGESQDVTDKNTGILVFQDKNNPTYIVWEKVEEVSFN